MYEFLILGTARDPHVKRVANRLENAGVSCKIIDYNTPTQIQIKQDRLYELDILIDSEPLPDNILIWNRTKLYPGSPYYFNEYYEDISKNEYERCQEFRSNEWKAFYRLLCTIFSDKTINNPFTARLMNKILQQYIARRVGFFIPSSIVTNIKSEVLDFFDKNHHDVIIKSFSGGRGHARDGEQPTYYGLMTQKVTFDDICVAEEEQISSAPHFLQQNINKDFELRIVVVGSSVFPFKIISQDKEYTITDWRYGNYIIDFIKTDIDDNLLNRIRKFMQYFGLFIGHFDLIKDKDGNIWFLECNQDGQWGWLDDLVNGKISDSFAFEFMNLKKSLHKNSNNIGNTDILRGLRYETRN